MTPSVINHKNISKPKMKPSYHISILVGYEYMLNLPLFSYHTYELISAHAYIYTHASIPCRDMINIYKLTGFSLVFVSWHRIV